MPLLEVSHNVRESESSGRKRNHDEFSAEPGKVELEEDVKNIPPVNIQDPEDDSAQCPSSPLSSPALSEAGDDTLLAQDLFSLSTSSETTNQETSGTSAPQPSSKSATNANPPPKRKRLTPAEKEARDKELAEKKKEREEKALAQAAEKAADKAKKEEEKLKKEEEKAADKAKKEEEKAKKEEEKAVRAKEKEEKRKLKEEEDRIKADKKRKKEEELQRIQEEKDRKARSQKTLGSFFKIPSTPKKVEGDDAAKDNSPAKVNSSVAEEKPTASEYSKMFKPFFVKANARLAPTISQMDKAIQEAKSKALDDYIVNQQQYSGAPPKFDPVDVFSFSSLPPPRGKLHQPVRHIMETAYKAAQNSEKNGSADASNIFTEIRTGLSKIPLKVIAFSQDVRPPYYGTVTFKSFALGKGNMYKLARRSMARRLPLDYDYDSEAEWQDEEEGEDLDMEDEEEELDDEDDMDGFLDDSEDVGVSRRIFADTLQPEIIGPCFEDQNRRGPALALHDKKMEFIHDGFDMQWDIDPFSTKYWEPEPVTKAAKGKAAKTVKSDNDAKALPPVPTNAFAALGSASGSNSAPGKLVKPELLNDVKQAILDNKALSKVGIVDFIFHQFRDSASRLEVKNTIEHVAEKKGAGRIKEWELKPGHEISL
ncbi:chromatin assembly factor 1 subunit rlf2 [Trichoderma asperellum]|uniref:Chromatin assembly factor 1 subunit rlf2 n=1 Tax=Trichoderma asperellum TaxID=101201 RepID=A0A6V8QS62_TRIAP|nr:chromatin assembly factor 1 subunit A-domain-containing protein [Trichoderma asperelloides]GFP55421.1 chromatin assembly factor 1 subunit rlf2 [Trichoderma asperellum]